MARSRRSRPWEEYRSRVAISGVVVDAASREPVAGAVVALTDHPDAVSDKRTRTSRAGHFFFTDLPRGTYELTASVPHGGTRWGVVERKVRLRSSGGDVIRVSVQLELPSTNVVGVVHDAGGDAVRGALVSAPSGERTTTDGEGRFVLSAIEAGAAKVVVSAPGFEPQTVDVAPAKPGVAATASVKLPRSAH